MATLAEKEKLIREIKGVQRIVINACHGGFGLSIDAVQRYLELLGVPVWSEFDGRFKSLGLVTYWLVPPGPDRVEVEPKNWHSMSTAERQAHNKKYSDQVFQERDIARDDPLLVKTVLELGERANGRHSELKVVEVPGEIDWQIEEYDGKEWISEVHRTWE
jgi:hypothetical protein